MLIDTHCHLDASEFQADRTAVIERAAAQGVSAIIIPAVAAFNFDVVRDLAHSFQGGVYALGIHPIFVPDAQDSHLTELERRIQESLDDPRFVAIGEIGLDFFLPKLKEPAMREKQELFYAAQLDLAERYGLPLLLHVRRSQDILLKHLRPRGSIGGIAHAFNGSFQQAQQFIDLGFALGFGGAMTFERALQIRRLATQLPMDALLLETDAPDIPPAWLGRPGEPAVRNEPGEVARIAQVLADLRGVERDHIVQASAANARRVLPRLGAALHAFS
jgi:TatD DNase family protein